MSVRDLLDQVAHFAIGALVAFGIGLYLWAWLGFVLVMVAATVREFVQSPPHKRVARPHVVFAAEPTRGEGFPWCGRGCRMDLAFWFLGAVAGATVSFLV